jgi:hypothetical protein
MQTTKATQKTQKLSFRTGYSVLLNGVRVGHVERRKSGFSVRLRRAIGRVNYRKVHAFAHRLCPGMGGLSGGFISDME